MGRLGKAQGVNTGGESGAGETNQDKSVRDTARTGNKATTAHTRVEATK